MPISAIQFQTGAFAQAQFVSHGNTAYAVGRNDYGQLGIAVADTTDRHVLTSIGTGWGSFSASITWSAAIKLDGTLWTTGLGTDSRLGYVSASVQVFTQVGSATDWTSVICGVESGYGVRGSALYAWGKNAVGQLGIGSTTQADTPTATGKNVLSVGAGSGFAMIVDTDGKLWGTGTNGGYQLGLNDTTQRTSFVQVGSETTWLQVSCGTDHSLAVRTDGTLWGWGGNTNSELGFYTAFNDPAPEPTQVGTDTDWVEVRCGADRTYARKSNGSIYSWGDNTGGALGQGDTGAYIVPTQIGSATDWVKISPMYNELYVRSDAHVYVVGYNPYGQLALNDTTMRTALTELDVSAIITATTVTESTTDTASVTGTVTDSVTGFLSATFVGSDSLASLIDTIVQEIAVATALPVGQASTTAAVSSAALAEDILRAGIDQLVTESADSSGTLALGTASRLIDALNALTTHAPTFNATMTVAEIIATLEAYNSADGYDVSESGDAADAYTARVQALYMILDAAQVVDDDTAVVWVYQTVSDGAGGGEVLDSEGSSINMLLSDTALATIRLSIGGELFTGWVLNTDTLAPSEYQFADRQFNSACKHGSKYLMAAEDGIYEFTEDASVETVMTYIKTGKTDFGSDLKKRVVNSYIVYSASGNMVLKVTTSEYGQLQTRNYRMVPPSNSETTDVRRFDIGRGIKSRYWQFELVGDGVDCDIDEIGMLPVVLSRRI